MAVKVFLIGVRIFPVTQGIEYQKIFHTNEGTEDFSLIKISLSAAFYKFFNLLSGGFDL